jgi:hypothetical protein
MKLGKAEVTLEGAVDVTEAKGGTKGRKEGRARGQAWRLLVN